MDIEEGENECQTAWHCGSYGSFYLPITVKFSQEKENETPGRAIHQYTKMLIQASEEADCHGHCGILPRSPSTMKPSSSRHWECQQRSSAMTHRNTVTLSYLQGLHSKIPNG